METTNQKAQQEMIFKHKRSTYAKTNNQNTPRNDFFRDENKKNVSYQ